MANGIDGMLALVIARDAQSRLAEAELADHAELAQSLNGRQENLRIVKRKLEKALSDGNLNAGEMVAIKEAAEQAGVGAEVGAIIDQLYAMTEGGEAAASRIGNWRAYESADAVVAYAEGGGTITMNTHIAINENSDAKHDVERSKLIDDLREVITDAKDDVKGQASGQELELQMASQEYSRSSQLASSLLNVRNEVMKNFVQALRG